MIQYRHEQIECCFRNDPETAEEAKLPVAHDAAEGGIPRTALGARITTVAVAVAA